MILFGFEKYKYFSVESLICNLMLFLFIGFIKSVNYSNELNE